MKSALRVPCKDILGTSGDPDHAGMGMGVDSFSLKSTQLFLFPCVALSWFQLLIVCIKGREKALPNFSSLSQKGWNCCSGICAVWYFLLGGVPKLLGIQKTFFLWEWCLQEAYQLADGNHCKSFLPRHPQTSPAAQKFCILKSWWECPHNPKIPVFEGHSCVDLCLVPQTLKKIRFFQWSWTNECSCGRLMTEMRGKKHSAFPLHLQTCQIPNVIPYGSGSLPACGYLLA